MSKLNLYVRPHPQRAVISDLACPSTHPKKYIVAQNVGDCVPPTSHVRNFYCRK